MVCLRDRKRKDIIFEFQRRNLEVQFQRTKPSALTFSQSLSLQHTLFSVRRKSSLGFGISLKRTVRKGTAMSGSVGNEAEKHMEGKGQIDQCLPWAKGDRAGNQVQRGRRGFSSIS